MIVSADYSQIELRIMAHLSGDPALVKAFHEGADIHRATAADIFGVPVADVTTDQRRYIKAVNFGLIYGMGAFGLAQQLGIERGAAQQFIDQYFQRTRASPRTCRRRANSRASTATSRRCSGGGCGCPTSRPPADRAAPAPSARRSTRRCRARRPIWSSSR